MSRCSDKSSTFTTSCASKSSLQRVEKMVEILPDIWKKRAILKKRRKRITRRISKSLTTMKKN